jgi:CopG family nickel-responsive transcriptional regulator
MRYHKDQSQEKRSVEETKDSNAIRFGISADARLLEKFDEMIAEKGYATRSEAIRDLIRDQLVEFAWTKNNEEEVVGTLTLVYNHEARELTKKLTDLQHESYSHIISTLHVHLNEHSCLEVLVMRGQNQYVKQLADKLISTKGVKHGQLTMSTVGKELY